MKNAQSARYKAYALALAHLKENENIYKEVPAMVAVVQAAANSLQVIDEAEKRRLEKQSSATENKVEQREALAKIAYAVAAVIVSYAVDKKDTPLRESMSFSPSELTYATPVDLGRKAAIILAKARELEPALKEYGLSDTQFSELTARIDQFAPVTQGPRKFITERKQAGMQVEEALTRLASIFNEQLDGMLLLYRESHPDFYAQYQLKRTVVQPGHRKTKLEGAITDAAAGTALAGVEVTVKGTGNSAISGEDGRYSLPVPPVGKLVVSYSLTGYQLQELSVTVKRGQAASQDVAMQKA